MLRRSIVSTRYLSIRYTERLAVVGIESSVGSVGDFYDNAFTRNPHDAHYSVSGIPGVVQSAIVSEFILGKIYLDKLM